jgi:hypothetical protein
MSETHRSEGFWPPPAAGNAGNARSQVWHDSCVGIETMNTQTLLIIIVVFLVLGGGGYYWRGRR